MWFNFTVENVKSDQVSLNNEKKEFIVQTLSELLTGKILVNPIVYKPVFIVYGEGMQWDFIIFYLFIYYIFILLFHYIIPTTTDWEVEAKVGASILITEIEA